eukprot:scaffold5788_cov106-Phaeocystis_antarctica.AAC.1
MILGLLRHHLNVSIRTGARYLVSGPRCRHQGRPAAKWGGPLTKFGRPSAEKRAATPQNRTARRAAASLGRRATVAAVPPSGRPPSNSMRAARMWPLLGRWAAH